MKRIFFVLIFLPVIMSLHGQSKETTSIVKMRSLPSLDSAVTVIIPKGTIVTIVSDTISDKSWCKVNYNGNIGYILTRFIKDAYDPNSPDSDYNRMNAKKSATPATSVASTGLAMDTTERRK